MTRTVPRLPRLAVVCVLLVPFFWLAVRGLSQDSVRNDDPVSSIVVRIRLADTSDPLDTYLALDLGTGNPFVLHTVPGTPTWILQGARPNVATGAFPLGPGQEAVFEFRAPERPEPEEFGTRFVHFRNLRLGDIGRIGLFVGPEATATLDEFEVQVNGQALVQLTDLGVDLGELRSGVTARLNSLAEEIGTREQELRDLEALREAELASESDLDQLAQLQQELSDIAAQRAWLEGVLENRYPLFVVSRFVNPLRRGLPLTDVRVLLETRPDLDAGTRHRVFLKLGGHTVLLNPEGDELEAPGSYELPLDLFAVPLTASDLRRLEIAVLAAGEGALAAPDLLKLKRIALLVDGRLFYDSDATLLDRMSLNTVDLGPPVWQDDSGALQVWQQATRWLPVWTVGAGQGLQVEVPGEQSNPSGAGPALGGATGPASSGGLIVPGAPVPGWDPAWGIPPVWVDVIIGWLLPPLPPPPWLWPPPAGSVFQVDNVQIVSGWKQTHNFRVSWDLVGDAGEVDHFVVELLPFDPTADPPITGPAIATQLRPAAARSTIFPTPMPPAPNTPRYTLAMVSAVPVDPALAVNSEISPARSVLPAGAYVPTQPTLLNPFAYNDGMGWNTAPVSFGGPPGPAGRAVWTFGVEASHFGWRLGPATPGLNIAVRPGPSDTQVRLFLRSDGVNGGKRLVLEVGFIGDPVVADTVQVTARAWGPGGPWGPQVVSVTVDPALPPAPLVRLELPLAVAGPGTVWYRLDVQGGNASPVQPVGLFGVRLEP